MRYGLFALALTAFIAFSASPVLAECAGHTKTSENTQQSTIKTTMNEQSKPSGS